MTITAADLFCGAGGTSTGLLQAADGVSISRVFSMPNKHTFSIKPIRQMIEQEIVGFDKIIDPFSNNCKIATITNDLNPRCESDYHMDALDFLKMFGDGEVDCVLYDPPYSPRQITECYQNVGMPVGMQTTQSSFWGNHKKEIARIVRGGGKVLTFGWNSGGIGKTNGFEIQRILLVHHGGWHNDTICTVEVKRS